MKELKEKNDNTKNRERNRRKKDRSFLSALGPGIISGAADTDPSSIATYSQSGAMFGYGLLWLSVVTFPLVSVIQEMSARIGLVTGKGLAQIIKQNYSKPVLYLITSLVLIANIINIGADIGAMGASLKLIFPQIPIAVATISFTGIILTAEIFLPYEKYTRFLKFMTLSVFLYILTAFLAVNGPSEWLKIGIATIIPHFESSKEFVSMVVAVLGTTISPYLSFWQTSEEVEELVKEGKINDGQTNGMKSSSSHNEKPKISRKEIRHMRTDIFSGMILAQSIFWFIMITSSATLHNNNITTISTAQDAARALEPLVKVFPYSGLIAGALFGAGIIGTGLISVPVLAASASYALSESFGWKEGLHKKFSEAPKFYGTIVAATGIGLWINFSGINPMQALIYTAIINGFVAVPILILITKISNNKKILGTKTNNKISNSISVIAIILMAITATLTVIYTWIIK